MLKRTIPLLLMAILLLLSSCHLASRRNRTYDPAQVNFIATYNPTFDNILYPSMLLALSNYSGDSAQVLFSCSLTAPTSNAVLRIVVDSSALNYVTILQEVLPRRGQQYNFEIPIKWKYDKLYNLRQQGGVDLTFTCFINDEEVDIKNLRLNYRSVNECLLCAVDTARKAIDYRWLFMGYVNEDHPFIDSILSTALQQGQVHQFSGYQKNNEKFVSDQVFAIWNYALNRGIAYSSISCTSNPSKRATTQHIRFFDEVYNSRQANCIDACVFFASILRKIGLYPVILVEPCHAYLGYYTDKQKKHLSLLETTVTGWVNFPAMDRTYAEHHQLADEQWSKIVPYLSEQQRNAWRAGVLSYEELKIDVSKNLFKQATDYRKEDYEANKEAFRDDNQTRYQLLVVDELRRFVQPIGLLLE
ncbi:MAG: hypothetical protein Q4D03_05565 [Bacteroidales bacterium]|nr:hypothetical protein [Bacteroidales bacterium]